MLMSGRAPKAAVRLLPVFTSIGDRRLQDLDHFSGPWESSCLPSPTRRLDAASGRTQLQNDVEHNEVANNGVLCHDVLRLSRRIRRSEAQNWSRS